MPSVLFLCLSSMRSVKDSLLYRTYAAFLYLEPMRVADRFRYWRLKSLHRKHRTWAEIPCVGKLPRRL